VRGDMRWAAARSSRPKYGSLNFRQRQIGGSPRFGSARLRASGLAALWPWGPRGCFRIGPGGHGPALSGPVGHVAISVSAGGPGERVTRHGQSPGTAGPWLSLLARLVVLRFRFVRFVVAWWYGDATGRAVLNALRRQASRYRREPRSVAALLTILAGPGQGWPEFARQCRTLL
jgi:Protein of unknown function (DUF3626)